MLAYMVMLINRMYYFQATTVSKEELQPLPEDIVPLNYKDSKLMFQIILYNISNGQLLEYNDDVKKLITFFGYQMKVNGTEVSLDHYFQIEKCKTKHYYY